MTIASPSSKSVAVAFPYACAAANVVVPGLGYLLLARYARLSLALAALLVVPFLPYFGYALWPVMAVDAFLLARKPRSARAPRRRTLDALGTVAMAVCIFLYAGNLLHPQTLAPTTEACRKVYAYNKAMRVLCENHVHATEDAKTPRKPAVTVGKVDAECQLYAEDSVLGKDAPLRPREFVDLCYLVKAISSGDSGYCLPMASERADDCLTFLAATGGDAATCDMVSPTARPTCSRAVVDPASRGPVYEKFGTMNCDGLGYKGATLDKCNASFGQFFETLDGAYQAKTGQ